MGIFEYLDITKYVLSGIPGEGLLLSYKAESFLVVFLVTAGVLALNLVISMLVRDWLETTRFRKKKIKYFIHFICTWIHIFVLFYILYQLIGFGHQDLGPCQKVVSRKICEGKSLTKKVLPNKRLLHLNTNGKLVPRKL